jgi:dihydroneopterin aldolase/2-amino-4-hydroxy-6-hydroxymethyldihydropteridine diphosphokinase
MNSINQDYIKITNLKIFAHHGVFEEEKINGQDFYINAKLYLDLHTPGKSDDLTESLHYGEACHFMHQVFTEKSYDLIETACENLCQRLLLEYNKLTAVEIELQKPHAPIGLPFENVSVTMYRQWHKAYISFGSNMGEKEKLIQDGIEKLKNHPLIRGVEVSNMITTKPYGPVEQEDFLNGCLVLDTLLDQEELLELLHQIEAEADRKRLIHWGPRTLDMDIVFFDKLVYESEDLIIPHVDMHNRLFVLEPLLELCPNYRHPILGITVQQMLDKLRK